MKSIILSVQPQWCELIARGEKTIEVRKTAPKEVPFKVYMYCTAIKDKKYYTDEFDIPLETGKWKGNSHIVGEFVCDKIYEFFVYENGVVQYWNYHELEKSCLTYDEISNYIGKNKKGYALHISELKIYDEPKVLSEFKKSCVDKYQYCQGCKHGLVVLSPDEEEYALYHGGYYDTFDTVCTNRITTPPRSWCYVEELPNEPSETR